MATQATSAVPSAAASGKHGRSLISDEKFHQLYTLALNFHFAVMRGVTSLAGSEAALAGVSADLCAEDLLLSEQGHNFIDGSQTNGAAAQHQPLHAFSAMSERIIDALGIATANRMRKNRRVTVLFSPDTPGGQLLPEARAIAAGAKLPVIFVEHGNANGTTGTDNSSKQRGAESSQLISIPVDSNDVIAMYRVAHESIARARQGNGPTRIVCLTPPAAGKNGARPRGGDAVANLEKWLTARGLPAAQWRQEIVARIQGDITVNPSKPAAGNQFPENAA